MKMANGFGKHIANDMKKIKIYYFVLIFGIIYSCTESETKKNLFPVMVKDSWGFISEDGKITITPQFEEASCFIEDLARIKKDSKIGYINENGVFNINPKYIDGTCFSEGLACVVEEGKTLSYIDKFGKLLINKAKG